MFEKQPNAEGLFSELFKGIPKADFCSHLLKQAQQSVPGPMKKDEVGIEVSAFPEFKNLVHQFLPFADEIRIFFEIKIFLPVELAKPLTHFVKYPIHVTQNLRRKGWSDDFKVLQKTRIVPIISVKSDAWQLTVKGHKSGIKAFDAPEVHQTQSTVGVYDEISRIGVRMNTMHLVEPENEEILECLGHVNYFLRTGVGVQPLVQGDCQGI